MTECRERERDTPDQWNTDHLEHEIKGGGQPRSEMVKLLPISPLRLQIFIGLIQTFWDY